jgi:hypothetical protein
LKHIEYSFILEVMQSTWSTMKSVCDDHLCLTNLEKL